MILNEDIRAREVRLIGVDGQQVGVVSKNEALRKAADADLDVRVFLQKLRQNFWQ